MGKKTNKRGIVCSLILVLSLVMTACGDYAAASNPLQKTTKTSGNTDDQQALSNSNDDYGKILAAYGIPLPQSSPGIYVDEAGYVTGREKKAMFAGKRHGKTFDLMRF